MINPLNKMAATRWNRRRFFHLCRTHDRRFFHFGVRHRTGHRSSRVRIGQRGVFEGFGWISRLTLIFRCRTNGGNDLGPWRRPRQDVPNENGIANANHIHIIIGEKHFADRLGMTDKTLEDVENPTADDKRLSIDDRRHT